MAATDFTTGGNRTGLRRVYMTGGWIPADEWQTIVANVPIVSVDLLARHQGGLIFGKRTNQPAKGYWFLPGGRVHKCETRREAVHRVADEELGLSVDIVESLGAFEHIYDTSDVDDVATKHYLANGYVVDVVNGQLQTDSQHQDLRVFQTAPDPLHANVRAYLDVSEELAGWL
jgi:colanic acid biosynthesis protein WcaH